VDDIAGGRLVLGLGAGGEGVDASMTRRTPWTRSERTARFAEYVELTDRLLSGPVTSFDGRYYFADDVHVRPHDTQQPRVPFAIAAAGPRGMRLAARFGQYWVTTGAPNLFERTPYADTVPLIRRQVEELEKACAATGRNPDGIARMLVAGPSVGDVLASKDAFFDAADRFAEAGITDLVVQWPRADEPYTGDVKVLDQVAEEW
jgi:alkanesulfonate monooxygenase SsuD/methylene tetrahydromethanopterin reductase-like flavin-dependent oxidoreductase (luciferase family)